MSLFTGIISKNVDNIPKNVSTVTCIRVRLPRFHGKPDDTTGKNYVPDNKLPFARFVKPINYEGSYEASDFFNENDLVVVKMLNDDMSDLLIMGVIGNWTATTDDNEAESRASNLAGESREVPAGASVFAGVDYGNVCDSSSVFNNFGIAEAIVTEASKHISNLSYTETNPFSKKFYGTDKQESDWSTLFVWYCFNQSGYSQYFYGGNKTNDASALLKYHKDKDEIVYNKYKPGDVAFLNHKNVPAYYSLGIVTSTISNSIKVVVGGYRDVNISNGVNEITVVVTDISCAYRPGVNLSGSGESAIYQYLVAKGYNNAVACGLLANIYIETGGKFDPTMYMWDVNAYSGGICMWHASNYDLLKKYSKEHGMNHLDLQAQLDFLDYTIKAPQNVYWKKYGDLYSRLQSTPNTSQGAYSAAANFSSGYENPAHRVEQENLRGVKAQEYFRKYVKK